MSPRAIESIQKEESQQLAVKVLNRATESLGACLSGMKHVLTHVEGGVGPESKVKIKEFTIQVEALMRELIDMDVRE